jgi:hypothetical protein
MFPHEESLLPIFVWPSSSEHPDQIGTGIYLVMGGKAYILTAAHVVDHRATGSLYVPSKSGLVGLNGGVGGNAVPANSTRQEDKIDVAYIRLNDDIHAELHPTFKPLQREHIDLEGYVPPGTPCSVGGYPITKARRSDSAYQSSTYSYVGIASDHETYERLGYDPRVHIVVHYRMKQSVFPEGDRVIPPHPRGLSGGGIFQLHPGSFVDIEGTPRTLIGSMHTYLKRENCFIGTRTPGHLRFIEQRFPHELRAFTEA